MMRRPPQIWNGNFAVKSGREQSPELSLKTRDLLPVTLLLEERKNQWLVAKNSYKTFLNPTEFELGPLTDGEISRILDSLEKYGSLGKLTAVPRAEQENHFKALAHQDLLVALRELTSKTTTTTTFDRIVADEFAKIPLTEGSVSICLVGRPIRPSSSLRDSHPYLGTSL